MTSITNQSGDRRTRREGRKKGKKAYVRQSSTPESHKSEWDFSASFARDKKSAARPYRQTNLPKNTHTHAHTHTHRREAIKTIRTESFYAIPFLSKVSYARHIVDNKLGEFRADMTAERRINWKEKPGATYRKRKGGRFTSSGLRLSYCVRAREMKEE